LSPTAEKHVHPFRSSARPRLAALLALLSCSVAGCGSGLAEVSGTVSYKGKPLPSGTIQFLGQDGIPRAGRIQPDGTFSVQVPVGEAKIIVSRDEPAAPGPAGRAASGGRRPAPPTPSADQLPRRYSDWDASRLTVVVKRGKTTQDFALTSD
jgi:hypothetical protein